MKISDVLDILSIIQMQQGDIDVAFFDFVEEPEFKVFSNLDPTSKYTPRYVALVGERNKKLGLKLDE